MPQKVSTCRGLHHLNGSNTQNFSDPIFAQDMSCVPHADVIPEIIHDSVKCLHESLFPFRSVLTRITEISLGANPGDFHQHFDPKKGGLRFAYYPELPPEDFEDKTSKADTKIGYGAHADSGSMVTIMAKQILERPFFLIFKRAASRGPRRGRPVPTFFKKSKQVFCNLEKLKKI